MADETPSLSIIDEAKKLHADIKAENDRREKILAEEQKLQAEKMLTSTAGANIPITAPPVETPKQYHERIKKELAEGKYK